MRWLFNIAIRALIVAVCLAVVREPYLSQVPRTVTRGDAAMQQNRAVEAFTAYQFALQRQPGDPEIIGRLVDSALAARRPDLALLYFQQLVDLRGWSPDLHKKMAQILTAENDNRQALVYWRASLTGSKTDIPTLRKLADQAIADRDWTTATDMLNRLVGFNTQDEQSLYKLGLLTVPADPTTGLAYLDRSAVDPEYRSAAAAIRASAITGGSPDQISYRIGLDMLRMQLWPYAEHAFSISLGQGSAAPATLAFLGVAQDQNGRDGWAAIEHAYLQAPNDSMVNYAVALHWRLKGDTNKALLALVRAEAIDPQNPAIAAEIGLTYKLTGQLDQAAIWLNQAVNLAPNDVGFKTLLANFYAETRYNLAGEGLTVIQRIASQSPNDPDIYASLGWALYGSRQFEAARTALERALLLDPTNIRARYYFGVLLEYRGDKQAAIESYLYVHNDPSSNSFKDLASAALKRLGYVAPS